MDLKRVSVEQAKKLMDEEGYELLDVRSIPEYTEEHAQGAFNVPYLHKTPHGMIPNQDFVRIVQHLFPDPGTKIVTSCHTGGRGTRAAQELMRLGYRSIVDMQGGFLMERDASGNPITGWKGKGLPTAQGDDDERGYRSINNRANQEREADQVEPPSGESCGPAATISDDVGMNRFASSKRRVSCAKLRRELPGLKRRPYPGPLGERIYSEISAEAWNMWVEHSKMIINEYRINSADPNAMKLLMEQCEAFFFGEGAAVPEGYVPQAASK